MKIEYHKSYNKNEGIFSVASCCVFPWGVLICRSLTIKSISVRIQSLEGQIT